MKLSYTESCFQSCERNEAFIQTSWVVWEGIINKFKSYEHENMDVFIKWCTVNESLNPAVNQMHVNFIVKNCIYEQHLME